MCSGFPPGEMNNLRKKKKKSKKIHLKRCRFPPKDGNCHVVIQCFYLFNIKALHKQNEIESIESTAQPRASSSLFSQRAAPVHTVFLQKLRFPPTFQRLGHRAALQLPKLSLDVEGSSSDLVICPGCGPCRHLQCVRRAKN